MYLHVQQNKTKNGFIAEMLFSKDLTFALLKILLKFFIDRSVKLQTLYRFISSLQRMAFIALLLF
jgi:hypothetical protein